MSIDSIYSALHSTVTTVITSAPYSGDARQVHRGLRVLDAAAQYFWHGYSASLAVGVNPPIYLWFVTSTGQTTVPAAVTGLALRRWQMVVVGYMRKWDKQQTTTVDIVTETTFQTMAESVFQGVFNDYTLGGAAMNCENHAMTFGDRDLPIPDGSDVVECHCAEITFDAIERVASTP